MLPALMDEKPVLLTREGLRKLEEEYEELIGPRRREIAERIRQARDFGDIAENAEYIEAKNEQGLVEGRIMTLEAMIRNAMVIEETIAKTGGVVGVGTEVKVKMDGGDEKFSIVGPAEADPLAGRISNESPLGRALLGHKAGDVVEWSAPAGTSSVKILAVN